MNILALDCATKTGWSIWQNGILIESGVQDFSKKRGETNGILFLRFRHWLKDITAHQPIQVITYERAHFRGGAATEICVGLQTRAQEMAAEIKADCYPVATLGLKKFATGRGNADKQDMIRVAWKILKRQPIDDNEADAVLIGQMASVELG